MINFIGNKINGNELWEYDYSLFEYNKTKGLWFSYFHGNYLDKTYELAVELEALRKEALAEMQKRVEFETTLEKCELHYEATMPEFYLDVDFEKLSALLLDSAFLRTPDEPEVFKVKVIIEEVKE